MYYYTIDGRVEAKTLKDLCNQFVELELKIEQQKDEANEEWSGWYVGEVGLYQGNNYYILGNSAKQEIIAEIDRLINL